MSVTAPGRIQYVATAPLTVEFDGERSVVQPGEEIPYPESWGRTLHALVEANKIVEVPAPTLSLISDDDLLAEARKRGYKVTRPKPGA